MRARNRTGGRMNAGSHGFSDSVAGVSSCTSHTTGGRLRTRATASSSSGSWTRAMSTLPRMLLNSLRAALMADSRLRSAALGRSTPVTQGRGTTPLAVYGAAYVTS